MRDMIRTKDGRLPTPQEVFKHPITETIRKACYEAGAKESARLQAVTPAKQSASEPADPFSKALKSVGGNVSCDQARRLYDIVASTKLSKEEWAPFLMLHAHVEYYEGEHSRDCAYWQPFPPGVLAEKQSPNYPARMQEED